MTGRLFYPGHRDVEGRCIAYSIIDTWPAVAGLVEVELTGHEEHARSKLRAATARPALMRKRRLVQKRSFRGQVKSVPTASC